MRRITLVFTAALAAGCTGPHLSNAVISPLTQPQRAILFVYPRVLQPGAAMVVQARLPHTLGATQCLSLIAPDGSEVEMTCGVVESRRVTWHPTEHGRGLVRLELFIGDRLGARREESICVIGPDADCDTPDPGPQIP
jgi:hypothetical protein